MSEIFVGRNLFGLLEPQNRYSLLSFNVENEKFNKNCNKFTYFSNFILRF